jgi:hypothetical protein
VALEGTAMLGGVFGGVVALAPAVRVAAAAWKLDLFAEAEVVVDLRDARSSFFYSWSELGLSPLRWLRVGLVGQRTRVLHNDLVLQGGAFAGVTLFDKVSLALYELNLGWAAPTFVAAAGVGF